jgi:hypothetical protein
VRRRLASVFVILALVLSSGCGPKVVRTAATLNDQFAKALVTTQSVVKQAYANGAGPQEDYLALWSPNFEKIGRIGYSLTSALEAGANEAAIVQVVAALGVVDTLIAVEIPKLSSNQRTIVLLAVNMLKGVLLSFASALGAPLPEPVPMLEVCHVTNY